MKFRPYLFALALTACSGSTATVPALSTSTTAAQATSSIARVTASCPSSTAPHGFRCFALMRTDAGDARTGMMTVGVHRDIVPQGYGPKDLQAAYQLPSQTGGKGQTIAIVDYLDDPNIAADLGVYRAQFGLPACTVASGCFTKLNDKGVAGNYPKTDAGWGQEESLDVDMASAGCPNCKIILVEAGDDYNSFENSITVAIKHGATVVSNSYGSSEFAAKDSGYDRPGVPILASAGDDATRPAQPASFSTVIAVGGTSLRRSTNARGWNEVVWPDSGSGCSKKVAKPAWQTGSLFACPMRTMNDIAAVGDPNTGVAVYDSFGKRGQIGWLVFGGTSVSSPLMAGAYALAGNGASIDDAGALYDHAGAHLNDVTVGSNGKCSYYYVCHAQAGYDGPTGWGTPIGVSAL